MASATGVIPLDREFYADEALHDLLQKNFTRTLRGRPSSWRHLLQRKRVVILAEAGSGKTTELEEQARTQKADGHFAFHATVQNVGALGFDVALSAEALALADWRSSNAPAWFFFDSVDEAKDRNVPLRQALSQIARGILGCEERAYIVLSGRNTDWEFRADLTQLEKQLPVGDIGDADGGARAPEKPKIYLMSALSHHQVAQFVSAKGVVDVDAFLAAVEGSDLWKFASRPLDLGWLVDHWRTHGRFHTFERMLETSLRHRLVETDPGRRRTDRLTVEQGFLAMERIGAAAVLQRSDYVLIPDSALLSHESRTGLNLDALLPDWSSEHRKLLINRPAFDAVVAGLVRLHHDNEGDVRSYLAARWLMRQLDHNCPLRTVRSLLFATVYERNVVIPSMRQTAAWLSLWVPEIAREVIARDPGALLDHGDSARLPAQARADALRAIVKMAPEQRPAASRLKRFAQPDLADAINELWGSSAGSEAARELLLNIIEAGAIQACADLAMSAITDDKHPNPQIRIAAGQAVLAAGSPLQHRRYIEELKAHAQRHPAQNLLDAIRGLFPQLMSLNDLLTITDQIRTEKDSAVLDHAWSEALHRIENSRDFAQLIAGLTARVEDCQSTSRFSSLLNAIGLASTCMLALLPTEDDLAIAIDAALLAFKWRPALYRFGAFNESLRESVSVRRTVLYRAEKFSSAEKSRHVPQLLWLLETNCSSAQAFYPSSVCPFSISDMTWLLEDMQTRSDIHERRIAAGAWFHVWYHYGLGEEFLVPIQRIAEQSPEIASALQSARQFPPKSSRPQPDACSRPAPSQDDGPRVVTHPYMERRWTKLIDEIRCNPDQFRSLRPVVNKFIDPRLIDLVYLLRSIHSTQSEQRLSSIDSLGLFFGPPIIAAIRECVAKFWRQWQPPIPSESFSQAAQLDTSIDLGILSLSLEASNAAQWPTNLTEDEAALATRYALHSAHHFPPWLTSLTHSHPKVVGELLWDEVSAELSYPRESVKPNLLRRIARSDTAIAKLISGRLARHFETFPDHLSIFADHAIRILEQGESTSAIESFVSHNVRHAGSINNLSEYIDHLFRASPASAIESINLRTETLDVTSRLEFLRRLLATLFGTLNYDPTDAFASLPLASLERLIDLVYQTRIEDEDEAHHWEDDKHKLWQSLVNRPGPATVAAVKRLVGGGKVPLSERELERTLLFRAEQDSEHAPRTTTDILQFERDHLIPAATPKDLQRLVTCHLADLQHSLLHSDFAQGPTLAGLPNELSIQCWLADQLEHRYGKIYSLERESELVNRKAPDIRIRSRVSAAAVAIEIKIAEDHGLPGLMSALTRQLVGQYLRDRDNRFGVLLIVHRKARRRGWQSPQGSVLQLGEVIAHLQAKAREIAAATSDAPQPVVTLIDVSSATKRQQ